MPDDDAADGVELVGGVEKRELRVVAYDPSWPATYALHRDRIAAALASRAVRIEHVGSTAVPGLAAKPIVDIQVSVEGVRNESAYVPLMERAGYVLRVRSPGHRMMRTPALDVHVHLCEPGSDWERRHLVFRDWLRANPEDRERYAAVKRDLARRQWSDMNAYAEAKTPIITEILARAREGSTA